MTGPSEDIEYTDPVQAGERTELAWTRTAISFAALGAALLRDQPLAGAPILVLSAVIWRLGRLWRLSRRPADSRTVTGRVAVTAIAVTGVSLIALVIALLSNSPGLPSP